MWNMNASKKFNLRAAGWQFLTNFGKIDVDWTSQERI